MLETVLPGALLTLIPTVRLEVFLKVFFPLPSLVVPPMALSSCHVLESPSGIVHGPLGRGPPPKRSQSPPTSRRGPNVSPKPPPGAGTGYVRFDEGPSHPPPPVSRQPAVQVVLPLSLLARLLNPWRIIFVLWISSVPLWTLLRLRHFVLGWFPPPVPVPSEPVLTSPQGSCTRIGG